LKKQLALLEELQQHDARLQEEESALRTLPEKLQQKRNDLAKLEAIVARERQALADAERFKRDLESQLKSDEANAAKAKTKLQAVKTSKDYMAAQRELEATRRAISEREEEILKLIESVEAKKTAIAQMAKDVADLAAIVSEEEKVVEAKVAEVRARTAGERAARDAVAAKVRPDVLKKYGSIRMRRGLAVVPVVKGVCQGCHMSIPPQLYNLLQRGTSVETCPQCNRIIYWDQLMAEKKLEAGESEPGSST
jgi:predicted  nucleic acid-binding Zn-ribbon protein